MKPKIKIFIDLDDHEINLHEVSDMAVVLADAYPEVGHWVASFGFLTYKVVRETDSVVVEVHEGFGYHDLYGPFNVNEC